MQRSSVAPFRLAVQHIEAGRWSLARGILTRLVQKDGGDPTILSAMALACAHDGQPVQAEYFAGLVLARTLTEPSPLLTVGDALRVIGRPERAADAFRAAVQVSPGDIAASIGLASALQAAQRPAEAVQVLQNLSALVPAAEEDARVLSILGACLHKIGRIEEGLPLLRRAAELDPLNVAHAEQYANALTYADVDPAEQLAAMKRHGDLLATAMPLMPPPPRRPDGKVRVLVLSPDLRNHATAFFAEPILDHLDRSRFWVAAYMLSGREDAVSSRLKAKVDLWRNVATVPSAQIAKRIREDEIDVVLDLAGLTAGHVLPALAMAPARIQATMIGFPSTTGTRGMGYRIVDSVAEPDGSEQHHTERLLRLDPCCVCYLPPAYAPPVRPREPGAPVTFAAFCNIAKLNGGLLRLWAKVLDAVPGSRLRLRHQALAEEAVRTDLSARFSALGVDPSRLSLEPPTGPADVLAAYHDADVTLDTFPYNGTTTICESLLMGVPVVTLSGRTSASRMGRSLVTAAGMPELCATSEAEYVRIAAELVGDRDRLAALRAGLRERFTRSPVCDGAAYAARLGDALLRVLAEG